MQVGTASTNALIAARRKLDKNFEGEVEDLPIVQTSLAYGVYMAVSSNLRYSFRPFKTFVLVYAFPVILL